MKKILVLLTLCLFSTKVFAGPEIIYKSSMKERYRRIALSVAAQLHLDPALLFSIITHESDWQPKALSNKGALGLMQLMPQTAKSWGVKDPFDPDENIWGGARYLKHLLALFDRNIPLAVAAYHAGEERIIRDGQIPDIPETQAYVRVVLDTYFNLSHGR